MLPKQKRLTRKDFTNLSRLQTCITPYFDVKLSKQDGFKVACIVIKKRFKKAVERNRVKRKVYSAIREGLINKKGYFIFYPKKEIINASYQDILNQIKKISF